MEPNEIDAFLEHAQIYFSGIKIDGVFYTWDEWDEQHGD